MDTRRYTYRLTWSEEDEEHVGLCAEFPSLSHLDPDGIEAMRGIQALVKSVVEEMLARDEAPPAPLSTKAFSGEFRVRIPPDLHRRLAISAAENGVSLNRFVSMKLAT